MPHTCTATTGALGDGGGAGHPGHRRRERPLPGSEFTTRSANDWECAAHRTVGAPMTGHAHRVDDRVGCQLDD
ncbi:hypothetical protein [Streptomyces sp. NPDC020742]|uniref:hypothetical protein n=1 Tax=Streptomyces sp. NPDC020742 TaxID=3154897 RepID=UPI0033E0910E